MGIVYAVSWEASGCLQQDAATIQCLEPLFANVVVAVVSLVGVALFVMLVVGGFKFLLSGGDQKQLESAKNTVTYALLGLVVIVVAFLILKTISVFTGLPDILKFIIPK
ncbi:hypothetical protein HYV22_03690 [Candidatus Gottesmanbacteria bacterium]|nr:hypothetical protein [Candidatus Gottesmanbacteria bacterium]